MTEHAPLLLDVTRLVWRRWMGRLPTGIDRVCLAYLDHFGPQAQAVVQHRRLRRILNRRTSGALFAALADAKSDFRRAIVTGSLRIGFRRGDQGRDRLYLNVGHTGLNDDGFRAWVRGAGVRPVYLVHDLIPLTHPEYCRAGERDKHEERMRTVLATGAGIIANSHVTMGDLAQFARGVGLALPPGLVAPLGSDALPPATAPSDHRRPTFVMLGTIEARKNHLMLLQIWTRLVQRLGDRAPVLLVIGQRGWECEQAVDLLERSESLKHSVIEIGHCSDAMLANHLAGARALLFPSLVEGYGLPLVEGLRAGVPVIASDLPVFREIAGELPDYLDPLDGPAWERAIIAYSDDENGRRDEQIKRIAGFRAPTWEDHFTAVSSCLSKL